MTHYYQICLENSVINVIKVFNDKKVPIIIFNEEIYKDLTYIDDIESGHHVEVISKLDPWSIQNLEAVSLFIIIKEEYRIEITVLRERLSQYWWFYTDDNLVDVPSYDTYIRIMNKVKLRKLQFDGFHVMSPINISENFNENVFIPCNYTRSLEFYNKYPQDTSQKAQDFKSNALKVLHKAKEILDYLKIPFWLSSGTCLGYYRQCDVITYSKDVDIGIFTSDYRPSIIPDFVSGGFALIHVFGKENDSYELSFELHGIKLDIFFFYEEDQYTWNGGLQAKTGKRFKYIFSKFNLCWTEFLNLKVRIPCQTSQYIEDNYGKNWFIPVKEWDWKSSPPNVRQNGIWPRNMWSEVIQVNRYECIIY
ncbi:Fukutin [Nymphon striatum]|nr:Fukutin [Nymphon striatum]